MRPSGLWDDYHLADAEFTRSSKSTANAINLTPNNADINLCGQQQTCNTRFDIWEESVEDSVKQSCNVATSVRDCRKKQQAKTDPLLQAKGLHSLSACADEKLFNRAHTGQTSL